MDAPKTATIGGTQRDRRHHRHHRRRRTHVPIVHWDGEWRPGRRQLREHRRTERQPGLRRGDPDLESSTRPDVQLNPPPAASPLHLQIRRQCGQLSESDVLNDRRFAHRWGCVHGSRRAACLRPPTALSKRRWDSNDFPNATHSGRRDYSRSESGREVRPDRLHRSRWQRPARARQRVRSEPATVAPPPDTGGGTVAPPPAKKKKCKKKAKKGSAQSRQEVEVQEEEEVALLPIREVRESPGLAGALSLLVARKQPSSIGRKTLRRDGRGEERCSMN